MNDSGHTSPDWTHWLNAAGEQGLQMLCGATAAMGGPTDTGGSTPLFVDAWDKALNEHDDDPEAIATRFGEAVEQALQRMRESTRAGTAAVDGALQGLGHSSQHSDGANWLGEAYRAAQGQAGGGDSAEALHRTFRTYVDALTEYQTQFTNSIEAALGAFQRAVEARRENGPRIQDPDELHRVWIEAAEPAYEAVLSSDAYCDAFARLQNAAIALGQALQTVAQPFLSVLGIPSQAELERIQQRLREMRQLQYRNQRLQAEVGLLRQELDALRREVRAMQQPSRPAPRSSGGH